MKKLFLYIFLLLSLILNPCLAADRTLPSETGQILNVRYEDAKSFNQNDNAVKQVAEVVLTSGDFKGAKLELENMITGNPAYDINLKQGDNVILHAETNIDDIQSPDDINFYIADVKRDNILLCTAICFCLLLLIIGRKKGFCSLISILATVSLIFFILVPLVLNGVCPILSALIVSILSTVITIYLVGGFNSKSTSAIIGTTASLILACWLSMLVIHFARLTGFAGEESMFLYTAHPTLNFQGILAASMIIAALGALMDTSISIASTINEIHETDKNLKKRQLFKSGMNVGKDIIGTMANTLILVYVGSSLPLVLLSSNIDLQKFFNLNLVATEISSALIGSIAILACVPLTAMVTSVMVKRQKEKVEFNFEDKL